jgi:hypothetical protein
MWASHHGGAIGASLQHLQEIHMNAKMLAVAVLAAAALTTAGVGGAAAGDRDHDHGHFDRDHDRYDHDRYRFGNFYYHYSDYDDDCYFVRRYGHIVRICPDIY